MRGDDRLDEGEPQPRTARSPGATGVGAGEAVEDLGEDGLGDARAVEPLVREALARILPDDRLPAAPAVGGYWTRTNDIEIDIVGADRAPLAKELLFVGSIKWLEQSPFDRHDLAALHRHRAALTTEPVPVVAVSRSGVDCPGLDAAYGPDDLLTAWPL